MEVEGNSDWQNVIQFLVKVRDDSATTALKFSMRKT